jgi:uncharacterized protein
MMDEIRDSYTAFAGACRVAAGTLAEVARAAYERAGADIVLVFDDATGRLVDLDLRGTGAEVAERYSVHESEGPRARGRPKLGVVGKEVTLLPRHWAWLGAQRGGASATLRRLVDSARQEFAAADGVRLAQDAAYRFMSATAGDEPGFEEATRALFAGDAARFSSESEAWPPDVREYVLSLAAPAFS